MPPMPPQQAKQEIAALLTQIEELAGNLPDVDVENRTKAIAALNALGEQDLALQLREQYRHANTERGRVLNAVRLARNVVE